MNLIKQCFMAVAMLCCVAAMNSCVPGGDISPKSPKDLVGDWVTEYPEDGVFEGAAYDRVIEHYSFSLNESGYFEQFLLNDNELLGAKYARGPKASFRYRLVGTGDIGVMAASDGHYWKMKLADGVLIDPADNTEYTRATELMKKQMTFLVNCLEPEWLAEQLIGKWMIADIEGEPATTNRKTVMTFVSPTTAFRSRSFDKKDDDRTPPSPGERPDFVPGERPGPDARPGNRGWEDYEEFDVTIKGNVVTLDKVKQGKHGRSSVYCILDISDTGFLSEHTLPGRPGGPQEEAGDKEVQKEKLRFEKIEANFVQAAIGLWEGKVTSSDDEYTDGQLHRWELKSDGTYVYYRQDESGKWVDDVNEYADYFIDGTLLCMRWKNVGEGQESHREWWEIESIDGGVMKWKGLRMREDGTTYTATFQMTEVPAVAP